MKTQKVYHRRASTGIHGHMAKTRRQIIEDLKLIDVVSDLKTFDRLVEKYIKRKESE